MNALDTIRDRSRFRNLEVTEQVQLLANHVEDYAMESKTIHEKLDKIDRELAHLRWTNFFANLGTIILLILIVIALVACWL